MAVVVIVMAVAVAAVGAAAAAVDRGRHLAFVEVLDEGSCILLGLLGLSGGMRCCHVMLRTSAGLMFDACSFSMTQPRSRENAFPKAKMPKPQ